MSTLTIEDTLKVTRQINAPRERVFAAFTDAEMIGQWFGPTDAKMLDCQADFKIGGLYRIEMRTPNMGDVAATGVYREITPPEKIVFTWKWENHEDWIDCESLITVEFTPHGSGTEVSLTQVGFPVEGSRDKHSHGWGICFDRLNALLTGKPMPESKSCA